MKEIKGNPTEKVMPGFPFAEESAAAGNSASRRIDLDNPNSQPFGAANLSVKPLNAKATLRMVAPIFYPADVDINIEIRVPGKLTTDYLIVKRSMVLSCLSDDILDREIKHIGMTDDKMMATNLRIFYVELV